MDLSSAANAFMYIQNLSYILLFVLFTLEGPITNYVAGFASSLGFFNIFIIMILAILGNVLADLIYFLIGRVGKKSIIEKYVIGTMNKEKMHKIKDYLKNKPLKALTLIKLMPPFPVPGLIMSGTSDLSLKKFLLFSFIVSAVQSVTLILLGYYSGAAFDMIFRSLEWGYYIAIAAVIITVVSILIVKLLDKLSTKIEKQVDKK